MKFNRQITKQSRMRKATEEKMLASTAEEFKAFILENAICETEEAYDKAYFYPYGESQSVTGDYYEMQGEEFAGDEFIITDDGRIFYCESAMNSIEVVDELGQEEEPFEVSVAKAVESIHAVVESECRLPSDSNIYHMLWNLYNTGSCVCAEAVNYTIKGYAEAYNWESVRRLSRAMELVKENSL